MLISFYQMKEMEYAWAIWSMILAYSKRSEF
jgi:hypothetical protein